MRASLLLSSSLFVACAAPASNTPPAPMPPPALAPSASVSAAALPPAPAGPPLAGTLAATITDDSGFVYDPKDVLDQHALEACYEGYLATPNPRHPGLPGWARFRLVSNPDQRTTTITPLDDSNLPAGLRSCLATVVAKAAWGPGRTTKLVYVSLR